MPKKIEICVRAIINKERILICRNKSRGYYFFPGGHLKFGEKVQDALIREMKEELGLKIEDYEFIGAVENIFLQDNQKHHELNLVFKLTVKKIKSQSRENHIDFLFLNKEKFVKEKVLPIALKKSLLKWFKNKKIFWASQYL